MRPLPPQRKMHCDDGERETILRREWKSSGYSKHPSTPAHAHTHTSHMFVIFGGHLVSSGDTYVDGALNNYRDLAPQISLLRARDIFARRRAFTSSELFLNSDLESLNNLSWHRFAFSFNLGVTRSRYNIIMIAIIRWKLPRPIFWRW